MKNNKINITELLKDCPKGMKLNCTTYKDVEFDFIDETPGATYPIHCLIKTNKGNESVVFTNNGCSDTHPNAKCVIFPKNKDTWEGFVPPGIFKDGDILVSTHSNPFIFKETHDDKICGCYCGIAQDGELEIESPHWTSNYNLRLAIEEEKQKLFDAIKENGYHWNNDSKTLEKLISDKFNINTLVPFESKVLVRDENNETWKPAIFGVYVDGYKRCKHVVVGGILHRCLIPYDGNEHLIGKTDDCNDYYKTWEE